MTTTPATVATLESTRASSSATLTRNQAAELLGVDPRTVSEGIRNGSIPGIKVGRRIVIPRERFLALFDREAA